VTEVKFGPEYKVFSHENGLKFSKKLCIFPKMNVSSKKVFTFYVELLMQRILEVNHGFCPMRPLIFH